MPADVDLFNMLRLNVLKSLTDDQLRQELARADKMQARVSDYACAVTTILASRETPPQT
jgi:hypothetical protein